MKRLANLLVVTLALAGLGSTGCIKKMLLNGQIESTRKASAAFASTADFEAARFAGLAGLAQFEGLHYLAPNNEDGLYLLVKGYASAAFAFAEDDMEMAILQGDDEALAYHKDRAKSFYTRAIGYAAQWMEKKHEGFAEAVKSGREEDAQAYFKQFDDESDADILFWFGQAWMGRVNATKEAALIGQVYVGKAAVDRVIALNPNVERGSAYVILAAYNARTGVATIGEESFAKSKEYFDKASAITGGKALLVKLQMAKSWACRGKDESPGRRDSFAMYQKLLTEVLAADDPMPEIRLTNAIAKRRARRYLSKKWVVEVAREDCGWDLSMVPPAPPVAE